MDRWIEGTTLAEQLDAGAWPAEQLPRLAAELLRGLDGLHCAGVVFRELAPCRVLIAADDGRAVLTDFELAKLMDNVPSVSGDWPTDPYRAPRSGIGTRHGGERSLQLESPPAARSVKHVARRSKPECCQASLG